MGKHRQTGVQHGSKGDKALAEVNILQHTDVKTGVVCSYDKFAEHVDTLKKLAVKSHIMHKHAACLLHGGKNYVCGINKYFTVRINDNPFRIGVHAEMDALASCSPRLIKGMDILVIRINRAQKLMYSRPCSSCIGKLQQREIRKAYYSTHTGEIMYEFVDKMEKFHDSSSQNIRKKLQCECG